VFDIALEKSIDGAHGEHYRGQTLSVDGVQTLS